MPYSGDPSESPEDELRFLIGDTDTSNHLLSDDEVIYWLSKHPRVECAAYHAARGLLSKYAGRRSKSVGPTSISYGEVVGNLERILPQLASQCPGGGRLSIGAPYAGGIDSPLQSTSVDWSNNRG